MSQFQVKLLNPHAEVPCRGSQGAAGYDLYSSVDCLITPGERKAVNTSIAIKVPQWTYGRVAPRSGLAFKYGIDVMAGVIDEDYRGEVKVILVNLGKDIFRVSQGDRIAQLVLEKIVTPDVQVVRELGDTSRGDGGFGSTGI